MPKDELDDEVDPLTEDADVVDAADEDDDEFEDEDDEDEDDDDDVEDGGDIEARAAFTQEIGGEGGSPGEDMEIFRRAGRNTAGSEASETMPGGSRGRSVERRDEDDVLIKRVP